jgi:hypothetical protein
MDLFLKDRLGLDSLELGLEVFGSEGAGVASTARVVHVVRVVLKLIALAAPIGWFMVLSDMLRVWPELT